MSGSELQQLAERIAAQAEPGEQIEAYVARGRRTSVLAYGGEVESLTQAESAGVGVRVVADHRQGFAYAGTLDEATVGDTLSEARDNARYGAPDEHFGLAVPDGVAPPDIDLWRDELAALDPQRKVELAIELERETIARDPRITGVRSATYADGAGEAFVATSTGISVGGRSTICYLSVSALAADGDDSTIGYGLSVGRQPGDITVDEAATDAAERATRLLGAKQPATSKVSLVLEPRLTATVLGIIGGMLNGERVLKGRSPFADRVGETIASPLLTFVDDPTDPASLGADTHDGEGLATRRTPLLDGGVLQGFLHNTYTARRAGTVSTASAVRGYMSTPGVGTQALAVAPGSGDLEDLVRGVEHGILVQSMTGLHSGVNAVSGDFSVGVEGLMIRDGARAEPVREATVASTLQRLLLDITAVGADLEWQPGGTGGVTLVIPDVSLSGA